MSAIRSKELKTPRDYEKLAIALAGLLIGATLWIIGARFTIDGIFWIVNFILSFVRTPFRLPVPPNWFLYVAFSPIPLICSSVEWSLPITRKFERIKLAKASTVVIWCTTAAIDVLTTYAGVSQPPSDAWATLKGIANSVILSVAVSIVLTFVPEWLIRVSWRQLWR